MPDVLDDFEFGELPELSVRGRGSTSKWVPVAERLRENRGRWARIARVQGDDLKGVRGVAAAIRKGQLGFGPKGAFDARSGRNPENGAYEIWVICKAVGQLTGPGSLPPGRPVSTAPPGLRPLCECGHPYAGHGNYGCQQNVGRGKCKCASYKPRP